MNVSMQYAYTQCLQKVKTHVASYSKENFGFLLFTKFHQIWQAATAMNGVYTQYLVMLYDKMWQKSLMS